MGHDNLYYLAEEAVKRVFSDKSVPIETNIESLETLKNEIEILIESLEFSL